MPAPDKVDQAFDVILHGDVAELARMLDAGMPVDARANGGTTLLKYAAGEPHCQTVRLLLERGADPNGADDRDFTPLHVAAGHWCLDVTRMLLDAGADVHARSMPGRLSVLHEVADGATVRLLCERGADPNARDRCGNTPLHWARWENIDTEVAEALLACGADPGIRNSHGLLSTDSPPDDWWNEVVAENATL